jgi:hypothetical protein
MRIRNPANNAAGFTPRRASVTLAKQVNLRSGYSNVARKGFINHHSLSDNKSKIFLPKLYGTGTDSTVKNTLFKTWK